MGNEGSVDTVGTVGTVDATDTGGPIERALDAVRDVLASHREGRLTPHQALARTMVSLMTMTEGLSDDDERLVDEAFEALEGELATDVGVLGEALRAAKAGGEG